jgi:Protein of unknown function (DUF3159)
MESPLVPKGDEPLDIVEAVGGPLGILETSVPATAFAIAYIISGSDTNTSAIVAVAVAAVLTLARLIRRQSPRHALTGLVGVAFAAFVATQSGKAENFFLPGLLANAAYAAAFIISVLVRRPLVGVVTGLMQGDTDWREDPVRMRTYARASWMWAAIFLVRLGVQLPLYLVGAVVALGIAKTAMGIPLFALGLWLTWRMVRVPPTAETPAEA